MRLPKGSGKHLEDRTRGNDMLGYLLSQMPSSQSGLTRRERDMQDAGWTPNDLYFARAAETDRDLIPNIGAEWSGGEVFQRVKQMHLQRQLDMLRRRQLQR